MNIYNTAKLQFPSKNNINTNCASFNVICQTVAQVKSAFSACAHTMT